MSPSLSLVALALLGAAGPPPAGNTIQTEIRLLDLNGVSWRTAVQAQLDLVARRAARPSGRPGARR